MNAEEIITAGPETNKFSVLNTKESFNNRLLDNSKSNLLNTQSNNRLLHDQSTTHLDNAPAIFGDDHTPIRS